MERTWVQPLPVWIQQDPGWAALGTAARHALYVICWRCNAPNQEGSLWTCYGGRKLAEEVGCCARTLWSHLGVLERAGFIVTVKRGGDMDHSANGYAIPGARGALDGMAVAI